jgi:hypothetical protein
LDPGSGKSLFRIPDPGAKNEPDTQHCCLHVQFIAAQLHTHAAPNQLSLVFGRWEGERLELVQAIEAEKLASREALKPLDELRLEHNKLGEVSPSSLQFLFFNVFLLS